MSLSIDEIRKVAKLSRLELTESDLAHLQPQISAILDYVEMLQKLDTAGIEPMAHPLPVHNAFREDEPAPSLSVDEALKNAPSRNGDYFGVPAVFDLEGH